MYIFIDIISIYAPEGKEDETRIFYEDLHKYSPTDQIIMIGDFNARIGIT